MRRPTTLLARILCVGNNHPLININGIKPSPIINHGDYHALRRSYPNWVAVDETERVIEGEIGFIHGVNIL